MLGPNTILFTTSLMVLAVIHYLCIHLYLYWRYLWIDMPVHFFGGAIVALGIFSLAELSSLWPRRWLAFLPTFLLVIMVALAWEVFELYAGVSVEGAFVVDTLTDLLMGTLGGVVGWFVGNAIQRLHD